MAKSPPKFNIIDTLAGVQPVTDYTQSATQHYTYADKIRFVNNIPKKLGGWRKFDFNYDEEVEGIIRSIYSTIINGRYYQVLGTAGNLYSVIGGELVNITPLLDTSEPIPDSLGTTYGLLGTDPIETTDGSNIVRLTVSNPDAYKTGDPVYLTGATGFNGLLDTDINGTRIVIETGATWIDVRLAVQANATGSGGGASVNFASGLVSIQYAGTIVAGERAKIEDATSFGGILDTEINKEFIVRKDTGTVIYVMTDGEPTSSVSAAGGAGTVIYKQIPAGNVDERSVIGYGAGLYGTGLYGTARESSEVRSFPRIWHWDKYGETIVGTNGNQGGVYQWLGDNQVAPTLVPNAPTAVNYVFVSDNILVTLGAEGVENRILASDQNDITNWTSSSVTQVYRDDIEGAGRFISHCPVEDYNLLFTEHKTYTFRYIGLPFVWEIKPVDESIGIIAPMARCSVNGIAFWMGLENFYMFRGGVAEVVRSNSSNESTCLKYVFDDLNWGQKSKIFAWYNRQYNEVWFHYPSANSMECDRVVAVNILDFTWMIHKMDRTAAEYPDVILKNPFLANRNIMFQHEVGNDACVDPMRFELVTNKRFYGKDNAKLMAVIPDNHMNGTIQLQINGYRFPQSSQAIMRQGAFNIQPTTERVPVNGSGRYIEYIISGEQLGQEFMMGKWLEEVQRGATE